MHRPAHSCKTSLWSLWGDGHIPQVNSRYLEFRSNTCILNKCKNVHLNADDCSFMPRTSYFILYIHIIFFLQENRGAKMQLLLRYQGSYMTGVICVIIFCMLLVFRTPVDEVSEGTCACNGCIRQQTRSFWFNELYDLSIQPLLNRENYVLSEDICKYWKDLQKNKNDDNYTAVVEKLFFLFPDKMQYSDAGPKRCRTCAVIGNSGNLKGSCYGHLIDLHDFVIRINMGPTKGYENDVGSKTTHRFIYPESATDVDNSTYLVLSPFKILDMEWLISAFTTKNITRTYKNVRPSVNANRHKVMILHPAFIKYVHEIWLLKHGKYPSTGFLAIIFALHVAIRYILFPSIRF
ncbi:CMP-N-acetylneuraminate-beta-galactosamide-alpha-2,3-sialyltransferase 1 [Puntigrus tetrazona]|uniref:CMP-N-acetylneuraminate-beta-galactosamide- alpha-2,3-sialyltransferase 1 n=1 Tax=Puntigrus tetrazona TaxID=1606681 RepID=UPI001C8909EB|nr:CMP-N-acetylneuraminate-beta-galactosamide-alpha-2,3-sialyltransferase 1 [Puntigrus tetrazona]